MQRALIETDADLSAAVVGLMADGQERSVGQIDRALRNHGDYGMIQLARTLHKLADRETLKRRFSYPFAFYQKGDRHA